MSNAFMNLGIGIIILIGITMLYLSATVPKDSNNEEEEIEIIENIVKEFDNLLDIKIKESDIISVVENKIYNVTVENMNYEIHINEKGKVEGIVKESFIDN